MSELDENQLSCLTLDMDNTEAWDEFVIQSEEGSFFHLSGWQNIIHKIFGHRCHYMLAKRNANIVAVLPLVEQKSLLFGHSLISTPFCVFGGVATDDEDARIFLEDQALALGKELNVDYVELRYKTEKFNPNYEKFCHHSTFDCDLGADPEAILAAVKKKQRAVIRHSLKNDLKVRIDSDAEVAYRIYSESVRNLGTPVFHKDYFKALLTEFSGSSNVLTVEKSGKPLSSVLSFYFKGEVLPYYGGGLYEARAQKSNDHMYYQLMCHARELGCSRFDFGRSKNGSGAYKYKASWGIEAKPLHYLRALVKAEEHPNLSPNNPKYALFIRMWQILPVQVSRFIGPFLSKYLG